MHRTSHRPLVTGAVSPRPPSCSQSAWRSLAFCHAVARPSTCSPRCWRCRPPCSTCSFTRLSSSACRPRTSSSAARQGRSRCWLAGRRSGVPRLGPAGAVRPGVPVDAAALLGPRHPLPGRLRQRQRADDAGRDDHGAHRWPDLRVLRSRPLLPRLLFGVVANMHWLYWGVAMLAGWRVDRAVRPVAGHADRPGRHEGVPLVDHLPEPSVRGDGAGRPRPLKRRRPSPC